jgi:hypothetical protein
MAKMVEELQRECLNNSTPCSQLLLKAYAIARKLNNVEMAEFCKNEIDGYQDNSERIPSFRIIEIALWALKGINWTSVIVQCNSYLSRHEVTQSIRELEILCSQKKDHFSVKLSAEQVDILQKACRDPYISDGQKRVAAYKFEGIISKVRKTILDWVLELNDADALEENADFGSDKNDKTQNTTVINISGPINGANIVGSMTNSSATVNNNGKLDFESLRQLVEQIRNELGKVQTAKSEETIALKEKIEQLEQSIENRDESSVVNTLKNIAIGAVSSGFWQVGAMVSSYISTMMG